VSFAFALASDSAWGLLGVGGRLAMIGLGRFSWHDTGNRIGWP
jgi:hypothetical protein